MLPPWVCADRASVLGIDTNIGIAPGAALSAPSSPPFTAYCAQTIRPPRCKVLTLAVPAPPKAQEFPHVLPACACCVCSVPIALSCARATGRKHGDKNGDDDNNANNPRSKEQEWTHWDLNPGPSACEADVIPLHHVPLAVRPRYAMQSLNGPTSEVVAAPARQLQPRAPSIPLNVAIAWKAEARRTERHFAPSAPPRAGSHARAFARWLLQACSCCDALRLWAVSMQSGPDAPTNMRRAMALCS